MLIVHIFDTLVIAHILSGLVGLASVWMPIISKKGGRLHRKAGAVFVKSMLVTGIVATGIATSTLIAPVETHPHLLDHPLFVGGRETIRAIFGWMMLYLAFLTVNLARFGDRCVKDKITRGRGPWDTVSQAVLFMLSVNCLVQGVLVEMSLMIGISMVGLATVGSNLWYLYKPKVRCYDWQLEHVKGLVGAGISVYTAFIAFGAVRFLPEIALTPLLWSLPLLVGLAIILYQQFMIRRKYSRLETTNAAGGD
jgi:uncharacterized membrane protein